MIIKDNSFNNHKDITPKITSRILGNNSRSLGKNPRALGTSPRLLKTVYNTIATLKRHGVLISEIQGSTPLWHAEDYNLYINLCRTDSKDPFIETIGQRGGSYMHLPNASPNEVLTHLRSFNPRNSFLENIRNLLIRHRFEFSSNYQVLHEKVTIYIHEVRLGVDFDCAFDLQKSMYLRSMGIFYMVFPANKYMKLLDQLEIT